MASRSFSLPFHSPHHPHQILIMSSTNDPAACVAARESRSGARVLLSSLRCGRYRAMHFCDTGHQRSGAWQRRFQAKPGGRQVGSSDRAPREARQTPAKATSSTASVGSSNAAAISSKAASTPFSSWFLKWLWMLSRGRSLQSSPNDLRERVRGKALAATLAGPGTLTYFR